MSFENMSKTNNKFESEIAISQVQSGGTTRAAIEMHKSARDRIRWALLKRISEGVYLPGERLKEMALAHEFEVSQAPVREVIPRVGDPGLAGLGTLPGNPGQGDLQPGDI